MRTRTVDRLRVYSRHKHETRCQSWSEAGRRKLSVLLLVWSWFWRMMTRWTSRRSSQSPLNGRRTAEHSTSTCTIRALRQWNSRPKVDQATLWTTATTTFQQNVPIFLLSLISHCNVFKQIQQKLGWKITLMLYDFQTDYNVRTQTQASNPTVVRDCNLFTVHVFHTKCRNGA